MNYFRYNAFLLILLTLFTFAGSTLGVTYRVYDPQPMLKQFSYRFGKSRDIIRFFADKCLGIDYKYLNRHIKNDGGNLTFSKKNYSDFINGAIKFLNDDTLGNPLSLLTQNVEINGTGVFVIDEVKFSKYRFFATPFLPIDIPGNMSEVEYGAVLENGDCKVSIYNSLSEMLKEPKRDLFLHLGSPIEDDANPFQSRKYHQVDWYNSDNLIFMSFLNESQKDPAFRKAISMSLYELNISNISEGLVRAKGFLPLDIVNPKFPTNPDFSFQVSRIWQNERLFEKFARPRIMVPDRKGFQRLIEAIIDRLKFSMSVEPVVEFLTSEEMVLANPEGYSLKISVTNFDSPTITEIFKNNAKDFEEDPEKALTLKSLDANSLEQSYTQDIPIWWISYPIYRAR